MSEQEQSLWGMPVVLTDTMPKGEAFVCSFPTYDELLQSGLSLEQWITAHPKRFCKIKNLDESLPLAPENPVAKLSDNVTVRREIDAIARQLHGLTERLKRLKATV